jgi:hypothetical protein
MHVVCAGDFIAGGDFFPKDHRDSQKFNRINNLFMNTGA